MKKIIGILLLSLTCVLLVSCNCRNTAGREESKKAIRQTEKDFEKMASEKGIAEAFSYYADSAAVIMRGNGALIQGTQNIKVYYSKSLFQNASVTWTPDFVDVSESGDLGYTYGKYLWQVQDSTGLITEDSGIFHTVWKKQKDGAWKYVWD
jgi:ketosteroid isomerase-like protein